MLGGRAVGGRMATVAQKKLVNVAAKRASTGPGGGHSRGTSRRAHERIDRASSAATREREVKRLERLVESLRGRVEELEASQKELLAVVSHDLRNPLSVILVSSRLLLRSLTDLAPRRQVDAIMRGADEINLLVQDLVDAMSIENGSLSVGCEPQEVEPIVDKALQALKPLAAQKPLELRSLVAPGLPRILGDKERLHQVLANLVGNAVKFTPRGGLVTVTAELAPGEGSAGAGDRVARFAVSDNGPGIPLEQREHLFARSANGAASGASGSRRSMSQASGLGVFVAKGIVEAHGGRMWMESEVGRGSTFYFTVPSER